MALNGTQVLDMVALYSERYNAPDNPFIRSYGALQAFVDQNRSIGLFARSEIARVQGLANNQDYLIPVITGDPTSTGAGSLTCTVTPAEAASLRVPVTFSEYKLSFTMEPMQFYGNDFNYQIDFERKLQLALSKMARDLDADAENAMLAGINTLFTSNISLPFGYTTDPVAGLAAPLIGGASDTDAFANVRNTFPMMGFAPANGAYQLIGNLDAIQFTNTFAGLGENNAQNRVSYMNPLDGSMPFGGLNYYNSVNVTAQGAFGATRAQAYVVPFGYLGMLTKYPDQAKGNGSLVLTPQQTPNDFFAVANLPLLDVPCAFRFRAYCGDGSVVTGDPSMTASERHEYQWVFSYAFVTPYNSNPATFYNPIQRIEVL